METSLKRKNKHTHIQQNKIFAFYCKRNSDLSHHPKISLQFTVSRLCAFSEKMRCGWRGFKSRFIRPMVYVMNGTVFPVSWTNWLRVYLGAKTCEFFLCLGVIVCVVYIVSGLYVVLLVLCFTSLVSFTGFYTEDEPKLLMVFSSYIDFPEF